MKFIKQSVEHIHNPVNADQLTMLRNMELVGRTCYKSEDKITDDSAERFVKMLMKRGHEAMLEHARISFAVFGNNVDWFQSDITVAQFISVSVCSRSIFFSANVRAWREYLRVTKDERLYTYLVDKYPSLFEDLGFTKTEQHYGMRSYDPEHVIPGILPDEQDAKKYFRHQHMTLKFVTNRGVTHEIVRHRPASYGQESTRYVNYGDDNVQFIRPVWADDSNLMLEKFGKMLVESERQYKQLLECGWRPEQAREVLPNALKTEIVMTATLEEWRHFFNLRAVGTTGKPHPQMHDLATNALKIAKVLHPIAFDDIVDAYQVKYGEEL